MTLDIEHVVLNNCTMELTLTGPIEAFIQRQVAQGKQGADEVVRQALLRWMSEESETPSQIPTDPVFEIAEAIKRAFEMLYIEDRSLFCLPLEPDTYVARKLHEVCINHKLAEKLLSQSCFSKLKHGLYVDIEFNRKGDIQKEANGVVVRPDIIIHNRKDGVAKLNFLVVECKKAPVASSVIGKDRKKIKCLIESDKYAYQYGLFVIYKDDSVCGELYGCNHSMARKREAFLLQKIEHP